MLPVLEVRQGSLSELWARSQPCPASSRACTPPSQETFAAFSNLDAKGTNYKYEVSLSGPAVELHNCMAKLLAHPLQRPFQTHASYSMLEDEEEEEEAPEMEAVV